MKRIILPIVLKSEEDLIKENLDLDVDDSDRSKLRNYVFRVESIAYYYPDDVVGYTCIGAETTEFLVALSFLEFEKKLNKAIESF